MILVSKREFGTDHISVKAYLNANYGYQRVRGIRFGLNLAFHLCFCMPLLLVNAISTEITCVGLY